ncbi:MAG: ABC transporter permease [Actinobacteria bacterium]|nr:ABC transporter permease [Actinomycetota bacterium]
MNLMWLVARREIRERLRARSFRVATFISVAAVVAAIAIPASRGNSTATYDVGVVNAVSPAEVDAVKAVGPGVGVNLRVREVADAEQARAQLRDGRLDLVVVGTDEILTKRAPDQGDTGSRARLTAALNTTVRLQRALGRSPQAAVVLDALREPVAVRGVEPSDASTGQRVTAFFGVLMLFVFLQQYGTWVLMGVIEEKASRVVEVLLAAVPPRLLVAGKVVGIGAVALVQGMIVGATALIAAQATGAHVFEGSSRFAIAWTLVWFVLGYGLYSWVYAAIGSLVSRQADAQNAAFPVSIPVLVGYIAATSLLSGGDPSPFVRVLAFLPPTAPMVMPMLIGLGKVAVWEILVSMGLVAVTIALLTRVAGDIYARAILHSGQRLRLRQVLRRNFSAA